MPYKIDWIGKYAVVVFNGIVTYQELRETGDAHYGDSRFDGIEYLIVDFSGADLSQIMLHEPTILASLDSVAVTYKPELKMAFVVRDEYQQQLCVKYIEDSLGFESSWSHQIVFSFDEARKWCEAQNSSDNET
jgi:hypothetical protein